jgi:hypothetical protein
VQLYVGCMFVALGLHCLLQWTCHQVAWCGTKCTASCLWGPWAIFLESLTCHSCSCKEQTLSASTL